MFKNMKKRIKNEKGLTLIELLAVIVILAIIAAIAIPAIGNIIQNSRDKAVLTEASNLLSGAKIAITDNACGAAVSSVITCNATVLGGFYEGTLANGDQVTYNTSTREYRVTFNNLNTIENKTRFGVTGTTMTEAQLETAMAR